MGWDAQVAERERGAGEDESNRERGRDANIKAKMRVNE